MRDSLGYPDFFMKNTDIKYIYEVYLCVPTDSYLRCNNRKAFHRWLISDRHRGTLKPVLLVHCYTKKTYFCCELIPTISHEFGCRSSFLQNGHWRLFLFQSFTLHSKKYKKANNAKYYSRSLFTSFALR
ncbi:hypothetical protein PHYBLDRAFT_62632 [Phycomyces blakesleeanus NRRL 1555(-)]|uniref:Uncharacterized protein n=1 Tax=Phycomyces blakesleeanus (strain ATCC 8743b / DSM 1359 / FGSC 10004 / NBRC 33097 / NRRL 1555) TaxID=763407 RepID=A0A167PVF4_PHYB8|nr:hypothetical protein PHYBLDRAFT_62632 [Phycomyces blakesleeanus NRRL 1555(-)]OAD78607.1 hypothetical protein PHYBLDRAFT_62632 [Phycomyces blakesleeanus NRRL 1555(-)]|eukprot:XP_018296647.1 hypothetical protein PHYBLDRAFT_62632 [Phycomyces blakesleeanus NRRL 1555(-)]